MNRISTPELRKKAAIVSTAILGPLALSGCNFSLTPKPSSEVKAKMARILRPAAIKSGTLILNFAKKHPEMAYIYRPDGAPADERQVDVDYLGKSFTINAEARMKLVVKEGKSVLDPSTTHYVSESTSLKTGKKESHDSTVEIADYEDYPDGEDDMWFSEYFGAFYKNGKLDDKTTILATTHIDYPNDKGNVAAQLSYAKEQAHDVPEGIAGDFKSAEEFMAIEK